MPVYLLHGFRWPRPLIRIHIVLHNLEDAAAEWLVAPATSHSLRENLNELYPDCMEHLPHLRFVEQYDPSDTSASAKSQPYAYVADVCQEIRLGIDVDEVRGKGVPNNQWAMIMDLRDKLAPGESVAWFVVVCGDEDRWAPGISASSTSNQAESSTEFVSLEDGENEKSSEHSLADEELGFNKGESLEELYAQQAQQPRGIKKIFSAIGRRKSRTRLNTSKSTESMPNTGREKASAKQSSTRPDAQQSTSEESMKVSSPQSHNSNSSSDKALAPPMEGKARHISPADIEYATMRAAMPKLQTQNLVNGLSTRTQTNLGSMAQSPGALSLIEDDEDNEVIKGRQDNDDDNLAAPAPTIKHGKEQDLVARQRNMPSIASFSNVRSTSPDTLRDISPIVRTHPSSFNTAHTSDDPPQSRVHKHHPQQLHKQPLSHTSDANASSHRNQHSLPAFYVPTGAPASGAISATHSRSASPVKRATRQRSTHRMSALNALEGSGANEPDDFSSKPARVSRSRRSSGPNNNNNNNNHALNARHSQFAMSSMSSAVTALYSSHEKDFKHRQSITKEELVARGLEDMDFTALR